MTDERVAYNMLNKKFLFPLVVISCLIFFGSFLLPGCDRAEESQESLEPFTINHWQGSESRIDLSYLLDPPAGKHGFVTAKGDHFYSADGRQIRFWGVNITEWTRGSTICSGRKRPADGETGTG